LFACEWLSLEGAQRHGIAGWLNLVRSLWLQQEGRDNSGNE
jgi:hypothetical protein